MGPPFKRFPPQYPNKKGTPPPPPPLHPQQGFSTNPPLANSMPMQPQMGIINPQIPIPFNNFNTLLSNGPNMPPLITQQLDILQLQSQLQNQVNNLNMLMNQVNQLQGQLFGGHGYSNLPQQFNQNMGFLQNSMSNMNPVVPLQVPMTSQAAPFYVPSNSSNQLAGLQNLNSFVNPLLGVNQQGNPTEQNSAMATMGANGSKSLPVTDQQVQANSSTSQQTQNFYAIPLPGVNQQVNLTQQNAIIPAMGANGSKPLPVTDQQLQGNASASQRTQNFFANSLPGVNRQVKPTQQNSVMPPMNANGSKSLPSAAQQVQGKSSAWEQTFSSWEQGDSSASQRTQNSRPSPFSRQQPLPFAAQQVQGNSSATKQTQNSQVQENLSAPWPNQNSRPSSYGTQQVNLTKSGQRSTPKWEKFSRNNFKNIPQSEQSQLGNQKSEFRHMDNGKRKFGFSNEQNRKGHGNERAAKVGRTNAMNQAREKKRSLAYTEQEIKQWREQRRKNYPTKANIDKKQIEKLTDSEDFDRDAKFLCEQLKDILAKQAELGVEVAEIPPRYLLDSEKHKHGMEDNRKSLTKRGRFHSKRKRRGTYNKKDWSAKQQTVANKNSSDITSIIKREPTLLEKLLTADIRRDKRHLLQVLRFMVMNSFFKDWPDKPLEFPTVAIEGDECLDKAGKEKFSVGKHVSEVGNNPTAENCSGSDNDDDWSDDPDHADGNNNRKHGAQMGHGDHFVKGNCSIAEEGKEEGEIID